MALSIQYRQHYADHIFDSQWFIHCVANWSRIGSWKHSWEDFLPHYLLLLRFNRTLISNVRQSKCVSIKGRVWILAWESTRDRMWFFTIWIPVSYAYFVKLLEAPCASIASYPWRFSSIRIRVTSRASSQRYREVLISATDSNKYRLKYCFESIEYESLQLLNEREKNGVYEDGIAIAE